MAVGYISDGIVDPHKPFKAMHHHKTGGGGVITIPVKVEQIQRHSGSPKHEPTLAARRKLDRCDVL